MSPTSRHGDPAMFMVSVDQRLLIVRQESEWKRKLEIRYWSHTSGMCNRPSLRVNAARRNGTTEHRPPSPRAFRPDARRPDCSSCTRDVPAVGGRGGGDGPLPGTAAQVRRIPRYREDVGEALNSCAPSRRRYQRFRDRTDRKVRRPPPVHDGRLSRRPFSGPRRHGARTSPAFPRQADRPERRPTRRSTSTGEAFRPRKRASPDVPTIRRFGPGTRVSRGGGEHAPRRERITHTQARGRRRPALAALRAGARRR